MDPKGKDNEVRACGAPAVVLAVFKQTLIGNGERLKLMVKHALEKGENFLSKRNTVSRGF